MTRRIAFLGLLVVLSQLASGCYWHRCGLGWRLHNLHCPTCTPAFSGPMPAMSMAPGGCQSCLSPGDHPPVVYGPPPVGPAGYPGYPAYPAGPTITGPFPIEQGGGVPMNMPPGKTGN